MEQVGQVDGLYGQKVNKREATHWTNGRWPGEERKTRLSLGKLGTDWGSQTSWPA